MSDILIERFRGDTYPIAINCKKNGQPFNIKGYTMKMSVAAEEDPVAPVTYLFQSDAIIDSSVDGKAHFPVTEADVDRLGIVYFDIEVIDAAGYKRTPIKGRIEFTQDITK